MDKSPWDIDGMQRIICVLQLKFEKALLTFKKRVAVVPSPLNTMLKLWRNCRYYFSTLYCGEGEEARQVKFYWRLACVQNRQKPQIAHICILGIGLELACN